MRNKIGLPQYLFSFTMALKSHTSVAHMITTLLRRILKESALVGYKKVSETIRKMVLAASESAKCGRRCFVAAGPGSLPITVMPEEHVRSAGQKM